MRGRAVVLYCLLTYAIAWAIQFAALRATGGNLESDAAAPWLATTMFVPGLVAALFLAFHKPARAGLLWRPTWRMIPMMVAGVAVPTLIAFAVLAVVQVMGWGRSDWFAFGADGVRIAGGPWMLGRGLQAWPLFLANVAVTGAAFAAMNGVVAVGEEFGWRAFLQGHLIDRLGLGRGIVLLGLIWSFWHLPALLAGYNYPETPVLGALVIFPLELVAVSVFMAWITLSARSFWPAVIAHGAGNSIQEGVIAHLKMDGPRLPEDLTTLAVTLLVALACWAWMARRRGPGRSAPDTR
ncbi:MAG: CPBP family intramembrane glutamic endopeptidase [Pseudomonadota bacterium]